MGEGENMNNTDTFNATELPNISMNNMPKDDFVDIFFDEPTDTLTEKDIIKPVEAVNLPEFSEEETPIETPIKGGMTDTFEFENELKEQKALETEGEIGSSIIENNSTSAVSENEIVNFDDFINNLSENVVGANKYIAEVMENKRMTDAKERELMNLKEKLNNQEQEFREYLAEQQTVLDTNRKQIDDYMQGEKLRLESEIAQFKNEADTTRAELVLLEENLKMKQQQFEKEKLQFDNHVKTENEIIASGYKKLENSKNQFEKEKTLANEALDNATKELENKQEEFKQYKEFEERKLELESQNLAKACARFKQIVSQLNSGFSQLQDKE